MKELRPKLSVGEIQLILKAMEKAGFDKMYATPEGALHWRFYCLNRGGHVKKRFRHGLPPRDEEERRKRMGELRALQEGS